MLDAARLRALADLAGPERAFLTVYLDAADAPSVLDAHLDRLGALLGGHADEREHFDENVRLVRELLEAHRAPEGGALAVFTGYAADLAEAHDLPVPVGTLARVGDAPYVRPAYELLDEHEPFVVVVADATRARIFLVTADDAEAVASVRGDVKNRVKKGGWSQKRYARRRDKQMEAYATDLAEAVAGLLRESGAGRLVLLGSAETTRALEDALPTDAREALVATAPIASDASEAEILDAAADAAEDAERQSEVALWDEIREQGVGPGLAAFGPTRVLAALQAARVDTVLVERDVVRPATTCRACGHVAHGTPDSCQACGAHDVFEGDLVEAMTTLAARTGAEVDFADPIPALADHGGIAALLRY